MKQGTTNTLPVEFDIDLNTVSRIEFLFKQKNFTSAAPVKTALWINDNENDTAHRGSADKNIILIPFSDDETYSFAPNTFFYLDTRITLKESPDNPATNICEILMSPTLFDENQVILHEN